MEDLENVIDNDLEPRRHGFAKGWVWIVQAFALYRRAPLRWGMLGLSVSVLLSALFIPVIGPLLLVLLMPVMLGCTMRIAQDTDRGGLPDLHRFLECAHSPGKLLKTGLFLLSSGVVTLLLASILMGLLANWGLVPKVTPDMVQPDKIQALLPLILVMGLCLLPVYSAYFFAPVLVVLQGVTVREALLLSFIGFWRNWRPLLSMALVGIVVSAVLSETSFSQFFVVVDTLISLLILMPINFLVSYTSYADIYEK